MFQKDGLLEKSVRHVVPGYLASHRGKFGVHASLRALPRPYSQTERCSIVVFLNPTAICKNPHRRAPHHFFLRAQQSSYCVCMRHARIEAPEEGHCRFLSGSGKQQKCTHIPHLPLDQRKWEFCEYRLCMFFHPQSCRRRYKRYSR